MRKYVKIYMDYTGYAEQDFIPCENCLTNRASDVHHLTFRSKGGKDEIKNLMALCRECHEYAHNNPEFNETLKKVHANHIKCKFPNT